MVKKIVGSLIPPYKECFTALKSKLQAIGYWRDGFELLPHPRWFVKRSWRRGDLERILSYLRSGHTISAWLGYSYCRFACGVSDSTMGCRDLSDGTWIWPEGLAHYVEKHSVRLPDEFIATMEENQWQVPSSAPSQRFGSSIEFWRRWALRHGKGPLCFL